MAIPVIDIFAGPGGLGEGFSQQFDGQGEKIFDIILSIEKDPNAHETLRLRSFFRQFLKNEVPDAYYGVVRQKSWKKRKKLIDNLKIEYPKEWGKADREAWCFELPYPEEFDKNGKKKGGYTPEEIIEKNAEIDYRIEEALNEQGDFLLIGGPPCQAYSLVGRSRNQGISDDDHRVHLYKEYLRIIAKHHPAVFVMENVKGLLSSEVDGEKIFDLIKEDLGDPNTVFPEFNSPRYKIYSFVKKPDEIINGFPSYANNNDYLIRAEKYGIPQARHRVILLGVRNDIQGPDEFLETFQNDYDEVSLKTVIGNLPQIRSKLNRKFVSYHPTKKYTNGSPKRVYENIKDSDSKWKDVISNQINKLKKWGDLPTNSLKTDFLDFEYANGSEFIEFELAPIKIPELQQWYHDPELDGVANHESRSHLTQDLMRYMFSSLFVKEHGEFPRLDDYAKYHSDLLPDHQNADSGKFTDRFRVQLPDRPASTITSHISKDGHYFIHYDPNQCRSLTVREAARIQTFPDNYLFCGSRTSQFHQVGNAVPPYLAYKIALITKNLFK